MAVAALAVAVNYEVFRGLPMPLWSRLGNLGLYGGWQFVVFFTLARVVSLGHRRLPGPRSARVVGWTLVCMAAGLAAAATARLWPVVGRGAALSTALAHPAQWLPSSLPLLLLAALLLAWRDFKARGLQAAQAVHAVELSRLALRGELAQARLQLLQAQIEPHFLFNSLANVRRLLRTDPPAARRLLADLMHYLDEALPRMREGDATLRREVELVRAYLAVHQVRMPGRLHVELDVPGELGGCKVPPMALLTLVENSLKHGLRPLVEGGAVRVSARAAGGRLTLTVADTGRGMGSGSGGGVGLANLRARLKTMYGAAASLALWLNEPQGVVATIELPQEAA